MERFAGHIDDMYKKAFTNAQVNADADDWWKINKGVQRAQFFKFNLQKFNVYYGFMIGVSFIITVAMGLNYLLSKNDTMVKVSNDTMQEAVQSSSVNVAAPASAFSEERSNMPTVAEKAANPLMRKRDIGTLASKNDQPIQTVNIRDASAPDSLQSDVAKQTTDQTIDNVVVMKKQVIVRDTVTVYKKRNRR